MKKIVLILDGMADRRQAILDNQTPVEYAKTPTLDRLFSQSVSGCVKTIPDGEEAGSAVANLNLLGFESKKVYKGRAVIEAAGAGLSIDPESLYVRTNFITLSGESYDTSQIESYSAHELATEDAVRLGKRLNTELFKDGFELKSTGSFRNVLVCKNQTHLLGKLDFMPPHDIIGKAIKDYVKDDADNAPFFALQKQSYDILKKDNDTKANAIWFWGVSVAPDFSEQNSDRKAILAETILMKGIGSMMNAYVTTTDESRGFIQFLKDKAKAAIETIHGDYDFIYVHIQAPDDLSHELQPKEKSEALAEIDEYFLGPFIDGLKDLDYRLAIASDHYPFSDDGSHGRSPAPFILYSPGEIQDNPLKTFSEENCINSNLEITPQKLHEMLGKTK